MKKIVVIVNDYREYINFELFCFEIELFKVHLVERCAFKLTNENIFTIKEELLVKLAELEFNKASCVVGLYSPYIFTETITMPKLNLLEENKAISLKLDKLYKNFEENYHSVKTKFTYNKTTRKHLVLAIEKPRYNAILEKLNELNINIEKVVFFPMSLANYIGKKHIFQNDSVGLFINLERTYTTLVVTKGTSLIDYKVLDSGIMTLHELLTDKKETDLEELEIDKTTINAENLKKVKDFITTLVNSIKTMSFVHDFSISEFHLNSEYGIENTLKALIEKELKVSIKTSSRNTTSPQSGIQALSLLKNTSPSFVVKTKWSKQTKVLL